MVLNIKVKYCLLLFYFILLSTRNTLKLGKTKEMLRVGDFIVHKVNKTKGEIVAIENNMITIKVVKPIAGKTELRLQLSSIGEFLFFNEADIDLPIEKLALQKVYQAVGNKRIDQFLSSRQDVFSKGKEIGGLKEYLEERNIKNIIHFSQAENISSILELGLVPIALQNVYQVNAKRNDDYRLDSMLNYTSCSIEFPNYKLLSRFRDKSGDKTNWAVIKLKADLLIDIGDSAYFYYDNASRFGKRAKTEFQGLEAFKAMFDKEGRSMIPTYYTTNPQAEVLISGIIDVGYIEEIHFLHNFKNVVELLQNKYPSIKFKQDESLFRARQDYMAWPQERDSADYWRVF